MPLNDFLHIVIGILQFNFKGSLPVFSVQEIPCLEEKLFFLLEFFPVMVPDDIIRRSLLHGAV